MSLASLAIGVGVIAYVAQQFLTQGGTISNATLFGAGFTLLWLANIIEIHPRRIRKGIRAFLKKTGSSTTRDASNPDAAPSKEDAPDRLKAHSELFNKKEVLNPAPGVFMAIGYGLANCVLLDDGTEDGTILIDCMESENAMREALAALDKATLKGRSIHTLVFTHHHQDHCFGARVVNPKRIVAHELTAKALVNSPVTGPITYKRGMRQFGVFAPRESFINSGIGPNLRTGLDDTTGVMLPTETFSTETHDVDAGSWSIRLIHCPGETHDQIVVHVASCKLLVASDNVYKAFPNIYAIRGVPSRDAMLWALSIDKMRALRPEIMLPLHTRPVVGEDVIFDILTHYRDAIQFVHDQTVYHLNRGKTPGEIVELVKLPSHLANHPWLQPFYGTVHWSVKAVFTHYLGWFSGDVRDLQPSAPGVLSREILKASSRTDGSSSAEKFLNSAEALLAKSAAAANSDRASSQEEQLLQQQQQQQRAQLALELSSIVIDVEKNSNSRAIDIRRRAISRLAALSVPATGRNYYSTYSLELDDDLTLKVPAHMAAQTLKQMHSGETLLRAMSVNLDVEEADDSVSWLCSFNFTDTNENLFIWIRRGVADVFDAKYFDVFVLGGRGSTTGQGNEKSKKEVDLAIETKRSAWCEVMSRERNAVALIATGEIKIVTGSTSQLAKFRQFFNSPTFD